MQITNEFFRAPVRAAIATRQPEPEETPLENRVAAVPAKWRKVNRSPNEEYTARLARVQPLKKFPDTVVAAFLYNFTELKVSKNGLRMKLAKQPYTFWHANSITCANEVGKWVNVAYQPDNLDWIAVLNADGGVIEIIPLKSRAAWFDEEELAKASRAKHAAHQRLKDRFEAIHEPTSEERINRHLRNSERMQIVNTLPAPAALASRASDDTGPDTSVRTERGTPFTRAGDLAQASTGMQRQRTRRQKHEERVSRETGTLDAIEPKRRAATVDEYAENTDLDKL